jgi:hypothetical protein
MPGEDGRKKSLELSGLKIPQGRELDKKVRVIKTLTPKKGLPGDCSLPALL